MKSQKHKIDKKLKSVTLNPFYSAPPREHLLKEGADKLNDVELLAILLSTGTKGMNVMPWTQGLLSQFNGLHGLIHADAEELFATKGIGLAKFTLLKAIGEIAKRYMLNALEEGCLLDNPQTTKRFLCHLLGKEEIESFVVLFLDNQQRMIRHKKMFSGTLNQIAVYPREIVKAALTCHAKSIIIAHNHPSGFLKPSEADISLTHKIFRACETCEIVLLDHIIVGHNKALSFRESGLL
ncbi:RadC family protein [Thorsellia kenyensis]|uniref:DNA repair protein RadC n=1 Tax=Thorsellia kenyensis TaxID=1549888 RepID=A0ABV6C9V4_9GAMM